MVGCAVHPNIGQFFSENLLVILMACGVLWIVIAVVLRTPDPKVCPFCDGEREIRELNKKSDKMETIKCPYCHAAGMLASFKTRRKKTRRSCTVCRGRAKIYKHSGPIYPDGTPLPGSKARLVPCPAPDCKKGFVVKRRQPAYGKVVPLTRQQLAAREALIPPETPKPDG